MKRLCLAFLIVLLTPIAAAAQPPSAFTQTQTDFGPVIEFSQGDFVASTGVSPLPRQGWVRAQSPHIYRMQDTDWRTGDFHTLWGRFRFERSAVGGGPIALYTVSTRNQFVVFLNGTEIFRNFAAVTDQKNSWYRPFIIPIPEQAIKPGRNEILVQATSQDSVGIGRIVIGPHSPLQSLYEQQYFWRITLPVVANSAMLVLGGFALLLWFNRRQETELLFLGLTTLLWYLRNYQYFAETTPFHLPLFNALTVAATYFTLVATFGFFGKHLNFRHTWKVVTLLVIFGLPLHLVHWYFRISNIYLYVPATMIALGIAFVGFRDLIRHPSIGKAMMFAVMFAIPMTGVYDFFLAVGGSGWSGNDSYLSLFTGFLYSVAFLLSFGRRAVVAFSELEVSNMTLERCIAETRAELAASEAARQQLVVAEAISVERERLMQEMHDGIGSNLITALAVARQQKQPSSTIKTLSRALGDIKITVDSLEPIEGDLVALIGNLRHRMAGDLRDAGIVCIWQAEPCRPLNWLDATNALHVLRIIQETIGNALTHSKASELRIGCREAERGGVPGFAVYVADNGCGFVPGDLGANGKGLSNIRARAMSLNGALECDTGVGAGTVMTLWLPYEQVMAESETVRNGDI